MLRKFVSKYGVKYETVLVDEAAQCIEAVNLIPLNLGCDRLILIGTWIDAIMSVYVYAYLCVCQFSRLSVSHCFMYTFLFD